MLEDNWKKISALWWRKESLKLLEKSLQEFQTTKDPKYLALAKDFGQHSVAFKQDYETLCQKKS